MDELEQALIGDSAAAPPARILEGLTEDVVHRQIPGAPHTIYQELWHIVYWLQVTLDWISGIATPYPERPSDAFPVALESNPESWNELSSRFFQGLSQAASLVRDPKKLNQPILCPSRPGAPVRTMSVREQLESLATHNAYHFGRIVLLRQLSQAWPPPSGGFSW